MKARSLPTKREGVRSPEEADVSSVEELWIELVSGVIRGGPTTPYAEQLIAAGVPPRAVAQFCEYADECAAVAINSTPAIQLGDDHEVMNMSAAEYREYRRWNREIGDCPACGEEDVLLTAYEEPSMDPDFGSATRWVSACCGAGITFEN